MPATAVELTDYDLPSRQPVWQDRQSRREFVNENADELLRLAQEGLEDIGRGTVSFHLDIDEQVIDQELEIGEITDEEAQERRAGVEPQYDPIGFVEGMIDQKYPQDERTDRVERAIENTLKPVRTYDPKREAVVTFWVEGALDCLHIARQNGGVEVIDQR